MNELALFAGAGGGILGGKLLGWRTVCAVEWNAYAASVLCARQNEGVFPPFPIWDDVQSFDGNPWRGIVDVVSGGFPCQDISSAGRGAGIDGARSSMWRHMARIIGEVRPRYCLVENSPMLTSRGLGRVLGDLAALGYDAKWGVLGADDVGAPHRRKRIWIVGRNVADAKMSDGNAECSDSNAFRKGSQGESGRSGCAQNASDANGDGKYAVSFNAEMAVASQPVADSDRTQRTRELLSGGSYAKDSDADLAGSWWRHDPAETPQSGVGRMAYGVAARMDRLKAIGNGQVPSVAALAFEILSQ